MGLFRESRKQEYPKTTLSNLLGKKNYNIYICVYIYRGTLYLHLKNTFLLMYMYCKLYTYTKYSLTPLKESEDNV